MMKTTIFDFSGMYPADFPCDLRIDLRAMAGTNLYCSEDAEQSIRALIRENGCEGIHLIDHGNYHYVSKLFLDEGKEETSLIVLDHHTDLQASGLFDLLSCGSWIRAVIEKNPLVREVCLLGPPEAAFAQLEPEITRRVHYLSEECLQGNDLDRWLKEHCRCERIWLSIDLDLLSKDVFMTNWDQGNLSLLRLMKILKMILSMPGLCGIDLCGGDPEAFNDQSRTVYKELLAFCCSFDRMETE